MIEALKQRVNDDAGLVRRGRFLTTTFLLEVGATSWLISISEGKIVSVTKGPFVMPSSSFALRAPEEELAAPRPVLDNDYEIKPCRPEPHEDPARNKADAERDARLELELKA